VDAYFIAWATAWILAAIMAPGLAVGFAVFPRTDQIRWSERIGLSFVFGLLPQMLIYFLTKNLSVPVTESTTQASIAAVTFAGAAVWLARRRAGVFNSSPVNGN